MFADVIRVMAAGALIPALGALPVSRTSEASLIAVAVEQTAADSKANAGLPVLTRENLLAIAVPVRAFRPTSAFDAAPRQNLTGRRFAFELPVRPMGGGGCVSMPGWRYSADRGKLELVFFGQLRSTASMKDHLGKVHPVLQDTGSSLAAPVRCVETRTGSYRASNAFGASTTIAKVAQTVVEVGTVQDPLENSRTDFVMATVDMAPAEAKQLVPWLQAKVEGELGHWPNGSSVACGTDHPTADMSTVWDTRIDTCIYRGFISRVAFIDSRTGKTIVENVFRRPSDKWINLD